MGKSARSNSKKKLRTERREAVVEKTQWIKTADEKRLAALAACQASAPLEVVPTYVEPEKPAGAMETEKPKQTSLRVKGGTKKLKGAVTKKGGKTKITPLSGKNQFHKKGKKGNRR